MLRRFWAWATKYEKHLSAAAMVAGFVVDNIVLERIDLPRTQLIFLGYALTCFVSIPVLHYLQMRASPRVARFRVVFPIATQFALGGFWSAFLIFYGRTAVITASWPFLLLLVAFFIGNEVFHHYHDRLVFTSILFFFALYSYAILMLPVATKTFGVLTFVASGVLAVIVFGGFLFLLWKIAPTRFRRDGTHIGAGALAVLLIMNVFYFTNILPPLPLALSAGGVYHSVSRAGGLYTAAAEPQSWRVAWGAAEVLHVASEESLSAYSAVFAPVALTTTIVHRWQWYDPGAKQWIDQAVVSFSIVGGRDGGYRGYSIKANPKEGSWRVEVETGDHKLIGRLRFVVVPTDTEVSTESVVLK